MSRERARRREARLAESARREAQARVRTEREAGLRRRRERRRAAVRSVLPRRARRWSRRTRAQRAGVALTVAGVGLLTYLLVDSWTVRVAVMLAVLLATPALVTMVLDRSTR
jgi:Flp pilus assembly protein TadB